jgi:hypothetical protein
LESIAKLGLTQSAHLARNYILDPLDSLADHTCGFLIGDDPPR